MPWFTSRKDDLPTPPPEPPPTAAARKAKEQGWLKSIRSKSRLMDVTGAAGSFGSMMHPSHAEATLDHSGAESTTRSPGFVGSIRRRRSTVGIHNDDQGGKTLVGRPSVSSIGRVRQNAGYTVNEFGSSQSPYYHPGTTSRQGAQDEALSEATKSLAQRLQELATAKEDGLLNDDEYRVLRKGVFEHISATSVYKDPMIGSSATVGYSQQAGPSQPVPSASTSPTLLAPPSVLRAPSFRGSLRSTRSTASFFSTIFKRHSRTPSENVDWEDAASSARDSVSLHNGRAPSMRSQATHISGRPRFATIKGRSYDNDHKGSPDGGASDADYGTAQSSPYHNGRSPRSRSIRVRPELHALTVSSISTRSGVTSTQEGSSAASFQSSTGDSGTPSSPPRSERTTSAYSRSNRLLSPTLGHDYDDAYDPKAVELGREISDLEYECSRLIDTFRDMERAVYAKYRGAPGSGPAIAIGGLPATASSYGRSVDHDVGSDETGSLTSNGRPVSFLAPLPSAATLRKKTSTGFLGLGLTTGIAASRGGGLKQPPLYPDESSHHHQLDDASSASDSSPILLESDPQNESALELELMNIRERKRAVEQKYEKRLEYLRAKLKGAMIRERLLR